MEFENPVYNKAKYFERVTVCSLQIIAFEISVSFSKIA